MKKKGTPYIGFSNEQLANAPKIPDKAPCFKCGKLVEIKSSEGPGPTLQFLSHCGKTWLVGIDGKLVEHLKPACSGRV